MQEAVKSTQTAAAEAASVPAVTAPRTSAQVCAFTAFDCFRVSSRMMLNVYQHR
jgi:hypothetical protein